MAVINRQNLQAQLTSWMKAKPELKDSSIEALDPKQIRQASKELGVKPADIMAVQEAVMAKGISANESAGGATKVFRDAIENSSTTSGWRTVDSSPLGVRMDQMKGVWGDTYTKGK